MLKDFDNHYVKIIEKQFITNDEVISDKTVLIDFIKDEKVVETAELAYITAEQFSLFCSKSNKIILDNCYIEDITEKRLRLSEFSVTNCFIAAKNLELCVTVKDTINFNRSIFYCEEIDFSNSRFFSFANFSDVLFYAQTLKFNQCNFNKGFSFKNSVFVGDIKQFEKIEVLEGEVNFSNTDFGDGNVLFQESKFGPDRKYFTMARFGNGFIDFTRTKFGDGDKFFERTHFGDGNISFRSADFGNGSVDFRRSEFGDGEKNFMHTVFGDGNIKFINSIFKSGKITFRLADFGNGDVDFHYTNFGKTDVFFERTKFKSGSLDFRGVEIVKGRLNFNHLDFGDGDFIFESLEMQRGTFFLKNSVFGRGFISFENSMCENSEFIIENVDFGYGSVSFQNSSFKEIKLKGSQINSYFDFRVKSCKILDLSNTVINDVLDLNPSNSALNVEALYLQGVRLLGRIYLDWERSKVKDLIRRQNVSSFEKSEQFRILKENYRDMGLYEYEDLAYVEFKRMQAAFKLETLKNESFFKKVKLRIMLWFEHIIFDKMGHYATNPLQVLKSMGLTYIIFSLIFWALELVFPKKALILSSLFEPGSPEVMGNMAKAFYHSAITFLTIGYGDYYPVGIIRILSAVEGFIGLFLMSYFTVAFVRKILR